MIVFLTLAVMFVQRNLFRIQTIGCRRGRSLSNTLSRIGQRSAKAGGVLQSATLLLLVIMYDINRVTDPTPNAALIADVKVVAAQDYAAQTFLRRLEK